MKLDAVKYGYKLAMDDITDILGERIYKTYGTKGGVEIWHELERVGNMIRSKNTERTKHWEKLEELMNDDLNVVNKLKGEDRTNDKT